MDDPGPSLLLLGIGLCLAVLALASAANAALIALARLAITHGRNSGEPSAEHSPHDPARTAAALAILRSLMIILAVWFTLLRIPTAAPVLQALHLTIIFGVIILFSEALPRTVALNAPEATLRLLNPLLRANTWLFTPLTSMSAWLTQPLQSTPADREDAAFPSIEDERRHLVDLGEAEGIIEHADRKLIEGVMIFGDTLVREIMVSRLDIYALDVDTPLDEALDSIISRGYSRLPVYAETLDQIVGMLYAKDLIPLLRKGTPLPPLRELVRPAYFVPETIKANALLADLRNRHIHFALVVDEYGGTAGMVTVEDLLEQIVGEIHDEYDQAAEPTLQVLSDHEILVDGHIPIDDVNALIGSRLHSETADRIGGLVFERLGRVPRVGDTVLIGKVQISVLAMHGVRVRQLRVRNTSITAPQRVARSTGFSVTPMNAPDKTTKQQTSKAS